MTLIERSEAKLKALRKECLKEINNKVGKPTVPSNDEAKDYWDYRIDAPSPRSFYYVYDLRTDRCERKYKFDIVGLTDTEEINSKKLTKLYHKNHTLINNFQLLNIYKILLDYRGDINYRNIYFTSRRAIVDKYGKAWNAWYLSNPYQFDESGYMVKYIARWSLLSEYHGESLTSEFFYEGKNQDKFSELISALNKKLDESKKETLKFLNFTRTQRDILPFLAAGYSNKNLIDKYGFTKSNVEQHNKNIIATAKEMFPVNNFKHAKDVGLYLFQQGFVELKDKRKNKDKSTDKTV